MCMWSFLLRLRHFSTQRMIVHINSCLEACGCRVMEKAGFIQSGFSLFYERVANFSRETDLAARNIGIIRFVFQSTLYLLRLSAISGNLAKSRRQFWVLNLVKCAELVLVETLRWKLV